MKHIQKELSYTQQNALTELLFKADCIFFDIETTGFSPANSSIYLIGCLRKCGNTLLVDQFFAESEEDEPLILKNFMHLLSQYQTIISFNGIGFDIPFVKAKCDSYEIPEKILSFQHLDIFKRISDIKFLLKLPNYKQKTIEGFLNIAREDLYSGGELINIYDDYLKTKNAENESLLLLHNYEDVLGMLDLLPILSYHFILKGAFQIQMTEIAEFTSYDGEHGNELIITLKNDYVVPKRVSFQYKDFYFTINKDITKIRIGIIKDELKYFYENYKEYFYLPEEDMAMHQSVATYVDKAYKERAKASNCYTRKSGTFLPQYAAIMSPVFKKDYKDKLCFFELTENFLNSDIMLRRYVEHIFENAKKR